MTQSIASTSESTSVDIAKSIELLIAMQRDERLERQRKDDLKEKKEKELLELKEKKEKELLELKERKDKELLEIKERKEKEERDERWRLEREERQERERVRED